MTTIVVRDLPDDVHRALQVRAALNGRSIEAEVSEILESAVKPQSNLRMGEALAALGREIGLAEKDFEAMERPRITSAVAR